MTPNAAEMNALRRWLSSLLGRGTGGSDADRRSGGDRRSGDERRSSLGEPPLREERREGERRSGRDRRDG